MQYYIQQHSGARQISASSTTCNTINYLILQQSDLSIPQLTVKIKHTNIHFSYFDFFFWHTHSSAPMSFLQIWVFWLISLETWSIAPEVIFVWFYDYQYHFRLLLTFPELEDPPRYARGVFCLLIHLHQYFLGSIILQFFRPLSLYLKFRKVKFSWLLKLGSPVRNCIFRGFHI